MLDTLIPTKVYDTYWRFAAERQAAYYRRLMDPVGPWSDDSIINGHRFTNAYRAADRVSQYLISDVQYREDRAQAPNELFFRTMLFKIFNKIETWETLEEELGAISWQSADLDKIANILSKEIEAGKRIYSAAYIMPSPNFGHKRKHANHIALLARMMDDGLSAKVEKARTLGDVYRKILSYPGLGPFLAFQYTIDLNYSNITNFSEEDFVVAGPGALDGISKCFANASDVKPSEVINEMVNRQESEFARLGLKFDGLFGRPLMPIDCQNLFCEISKYARAAHPDVVGISGRTRIKQKYKPARLSPAQPFFPPKWGLDVPLLETPRRFAQGAQMSLF